LSSPVSPEVELREKQGVSKPQISILLAISWFRRMHLVQVQVYGETLRASPAQPTDGLFNTGRALLYALIPLEVF
jgi:hypothetical protein